MANFARVFEQKRMTRSIQENWLKQYDSIEEVFAKLPQSQFEKFPLISSDEKGKIRVITLLDQIIKITQTN